MPDTLIMGNYNATRVKEGLLIKNVELSKETPKDVRPDLLRDLDVSAFEQMKANFDARVAAGKVGSFILLGHEGPGVGRIIDLRIENKELVGDLLVTNDEVIAMIERGELTERSIEWGWSMKDARLKGIALLSGTFGQDSVGWPDLTVTYTEEFIQKEFQDFTELAFKTESVQLTLTSVSKSSAKEEHMPLSKEDLEAIGNLLDNKIDAKLEEKMEAKSALEPVNTAKVDEALKRIQKKEREITVTGYVETLARKGYSNKKHLRASFEKFGDNVEAMEVEFKRLMDKADEDVKLEMEDVYEKPSLDSELEEDYKSFKENYPKVEISLNEFKSVCKGEFRAKEEYMHGKAVIEVK